MSRNSAFRLASCCASALFLSFSASHAQDAFVVSQYQSEQTTMYNDQVQRYNATAAQANQAWENYNRGLAIASYYPQTSPEAQQAYEQANAWARHYFALWRYYGHTNIAQIQQLRNRYGAYPGLTSQLNQSLGEQQQALTTLNRQEHQYVPQTSQAPTTAEYLGSTATTTPGATTQQAAPTTPGGTTPGEQRHPPTPPGVSVEEDCGLSLLGIASGCVSSGSPATPPNTGR